MQIVILAVGKLKEKYFLGAQAEYAKRLRPYTRLEIKEIPEAGPAGGDEVQLLTSEGQNILRALKPGTFVVALDRQGEQVSSEELARRINRLGLAGKSHLTFVIGGPLGLAGQVLDRADWRLSFSRLTFPHRLVRVMLLEQLYRSFKINRGEPYHR